MLLRVLFYSLHMLVLVPVGWLRRIGNSSRFSPSFHRAPTSWDRCYRLDPSNENWEKMPCRRSYTKI
ncbi:hypothetical protein AB4Y45_46210 [Paraburkholderia sp. EG287A]|uniref:hypothetical protein n=1 Tax=unclassified Paraburkholderia TaxID=2615204 RepID=UPI0034D314F8